VNAQPRPPAAAHDEQLMQLAQAGDRQAFGGLYHRLGADARRVAGRICFDRESARDAVQDAFLSIWQRRESYDSGRGEVRPWAMTIVRHRALDVARRDGARRLLRAPAELLDYRAGTERCAAERVVAGDRETELRASLRRLPPLQRQVITLAFFGGLSHREIAKRLALAEGTVKGRIRLGMHKLRAELDESGSEHRP